MDLIMSRNGGFKPPFLFVLCQARRVARKSYLTGCGGQSSNLEVEVLNTPGEGKRQLNSKGVGRVRRKLKATCSSNENINLVFN